MGILSLEFEQKIQSLNEDEQNVSEIEIMMYLLKDWAENSMELRLLIWNAKVAQTSIHQPIWKPKP